MRYPTCQQLPRRPAHGHTFDVASPTKKPIIKVAQLQRQKDRNNYKIFDDHPPAYLDLDIWTEKVLMEIIQLNLRPGNMERKTPAHCLSCLNHKP